MFMVKYMGLFGNIVMVVLMVGFVVNMWKVIVVVLMLVFEVFDNIGVG